MARRRRFKQHKPKTKQDLEAHAKKRCLERFGFAFNTQRAKSDIQSGAAEFLFRESRRLTHWVVKQRGQSMRVVYDSIRHSIVTVLPKEAIHGYETRSTENTIID